MIKLSSRREDSVIGANSCAGAALNAGVGVDNVDRAFGDSFYGALGEAGAASHAVVGNYVCHGVVF